ncbi:MAG TPA: protein-L-isoaspartate(D-aspartate) O-methyltransferase [Candidatus Acidoferrum sp.]|nr:protein-L-isoaspartate(D-aspartate) O-methyltransferase [Candidatus Acidoferrum sp.]
MERRRMVDTQLKRRGIRDPRVLAAMGDIPREDFVPIESRVSAYSDAPVNIGYHQTISQPYMTALMAECLELNGTERVLEIGAGSGYAAAVLGALAREVVTVEIVPELAALARSNLSRTGREANIRVIEGDGGLGYPPESPYDAISVAAAAPEVPAALMEQLRDPGYLTIPVGTLDDQQLRVIRKHAGRVQWRIATLCRFVPLRGGEGWN